MKRLAIILLVFFSARSQAQIFNPIDIVTLIFSWQEGGYEMKFTTVNTEPCFVHGLRGGWYVHQDEKKDVLIGVGMYGAITQIDEVRLSSVKNLYMFYTTLYCGLTFMKEKPLSLEVPLHIGYGSAAVEPAYAIGTPLNDTYSGYFIFEPNANALLRLGKRARIGAGVGFRMIGGLRIDGTTNIGMSGLSVNATFRFGRYE